MHSKIRSCLSISLVLFLAGCVSIPKGFLKPAPDYMEKRQLQMRQYDTTNEEQIVSAVAGVLQDLGFTLDESETDIGLVSASKKADAKSKGQIAGAVLMDMLAALSGSYSNSTAKCDKSQVIKASVIAKPSLEGKRIVVRVTFQRVVWNMEDHISRVESVKDPEVYQRFYDSLSKAIFLEAQQI